MPSAARPLRAAPRGLRASIRDATASRVSVRDRGEVAIRLAAHDPDPVISALLATALLAAPPQDEPPTPPHVVWIVADDLGHADVGFTGCADIPTPALDALAASGVVFSDGHVCASVCAPSRAGFLTGRYPQRFGFECNLAGDGGLLPGQATAASALRDAGYTTALVGKWHLGYGEEQHPLRLGFDHFTGLLAGSRTYFPMEADAATPRRRIQRDGERVPESELGYVTDFLTDEAVRLVREHATERPLFLYLSYTAPHSPNEGRPDLVERFAETIEHDGRREYAGMVAALDEGVGRVVAALEELGELDDTLLVFFSDNGGATTNHSDNGAWRGMKGSKWEGGHRVPFLVHWPAGLDAGAFDPLVSTLDLLPTALDAAGALDDELATTLALDGVSLLPWLRGERDDVPHPRLYWRRTVAAAVREDDWKLIRIAETDGSFRPPILVDLACHPDESTNVASDHPEIVERLTAALADWETGLEDPRWTTGERWQRNQRRKHEMDVRGRDAERELP